MFTGLIREMAKVVSFSKQFFDTKSKISSKNWGLNSYKWTCLTVVKITNDTFTVELSRISKNPCNGKLQRGSYGTSHDDGR